jgi:hypothetical protein
MKFAPGTLTGKIAQFLTLIGQENKNVPNRALLQGGKCACKELRSRSRALKIVRDALVEIPTPANISAW